MKFFEVKLEIKQIKMNYFPNRLSLIFIDLNGINGIFLREAHYDFFVRFINALEIAITWGDFLNSLQKNEKDFIKPFTESDEIQISQFDYIDSIIDEIFILNDYEFPLIQLAEEAYSEINGINFSSTCPVEESFTDYDKPIGFFETKYINELTEFLKVHGYSVKCVPTLICNQNSRRIYKWGTSLKE